jgi:hypothetical protein
MEDSMSLRRVFPVVSRLLILALAVLAVPACKKSEDKSPHLKDAFPLWDSKDVPHFPLLILEWDRDLDPLTFTANVLVFKTDVNHNPDLSSPWGSPLAISFLHGSFQMVIETTGAFTSGTEYAVVIGNGLESANGVPITQPGVALLFTVVNSANMTLPAFSVLPSQAAGGNAGEIIWTWTAPASSTIDFYMSPGSDDEDLLGPVFFTSNSTSGDTIPAIKGLVTGTTYHFRVIIRDSFGNVNVIDEISGVAR